MSGVEETWSELRYSCKQVLPEPDGIPDELDAVIWWDLEVVRCGVDTEHVTGSGSVVVFDLDRPAALLRAVTAYGGDIAHIASVLLGEGGEPRPEIVGPGVHRVMVFVGVEIPVDRTTVGLPLRWAEFARQRLAGSDTLIASYPDPHTEDEQDPAFLRGVPPEIREAWAARGLHHVGGGVWALAL